MFLWECNGLTFYGRNSNIFLIKSTNFEVVLFARFLDRFEVVLASNHFF